MAETAMPRRSVLPANDWAVYEGRGGGRASAALPLLDDVTTSPASRRLASARPALAPKCTPYFLTGPNLLFTTKTRRRKESLRICAVPGTEVRSSLHTGGTPVPRFLRISVSRVS